MVRIFLIVLMASTFLFSCEANRRKNNISDDAAKQMEIAMKDTAIVQVIDTTYNFGKATEGDKVEYNFRFKNVGNKPLVVLNSAASCGCTVAEKPEKPIMPGELSFIKVVFNSKGKVGHNKKSIMVTSNANPEFPTLYLEGDVVSK